MSATIMVGDVRAILPTLDAGSVRCCVTSPPYWRLRDYGVSGQIGMEPTPEAYITQLVAVFRAVRRVLADDGTLWVNMGDSYAGGGAGARGKSGQRANRTFTPTRGGGPRPPNGLKPKDLMMLPARLALALQSDGWWLRSDIIWHKPNPLPENVTDRPTSAHEHVLLLAKSARYYYDAGAIKEDAVKGSAGAGRRNYRIDVRHGRVSDGQTMQEAEAGRNKRNVWTVATCPYREAHFATFPLALVEPCILAGSRAGDTVLDPFSGSGATGVVALRHGRSYVGVELNAEYAEMSRRRIMGAAPLLNAVTVVAS